MSEMPKRPTDTEDPDVMRVVLFSVLVDARRKSDFERGAEAQRDLERLGVRVRFLRGGGRRSAAGSGQGGRRL